MQYVNASKQKFTHRSVVELCDALRNIELTDAKADGNTDGNADGEQAEAPSPDNNMFEANLRELAGPSVLKELCSGLPKIICSEHFTESIKHLKKHLHGFQAQGEACGAGEG